jgi:hypothetical protein
MFNPTTQYTLTIVMGHQSLSLFPSNHRYHAQHVKFNMKFHTFFHGLLTKRDKLGDHCSR